MSSKKFSLIIIVKDREQHLRNVLHGIEQSTIQPSEIIVVRMNEPAQELEQTNIIQVELHDDHSLPLARARNAGARLAMHDTLIFLDVDCIPAPDCFERLLAETKANMVSMVDPRYLDTPVKTIDLTQFAGSSHPNKARSRLKYGISSQYELFWSLGFCVSAQTYGRIGGFDEAYIGYGGEDTDFAFTLRKSNVQMNFSHATVYHQPHGSVDPPLNWLEDIVENAQVFKRKWHIWPMTGWLDAFSERGYILYDSQNIKIVRFPTDDEIKAVSVKQ